MNYDIINKNLLKLEEAVKTFPTILGKYQKLSTDLKLQGSSAGRRPVTEKLEISSHAGKLGLSDYIYFIDWIAKISSSGTIVYKCEISFDLLKTALIENAMDREVKEFLQKKTKRGMATFLSSSLYRTYNGGHKGHKGRRSYYSRNFEKSEAIISNYIIQNDIKMENPIISGYYLHEIANFEFELNTEIDITNDITKSILRKINSIKFDFRKLNFNLLKSEIESKIKDRMLCVERGEQIKCIESSQGLTMNNIYNVNSYQIGNNGNLLVYVQNDNGVNSSYSYRLFETISKLRENNINDILNLIENEG